MTEARDGTQEELPCVRGKGRRPRGAIQRPRPEAAVAAWAQEGLEEPSHVEGQEGRWCGDTPHPR